VGKVANTKTAVKRTKITHRRTLRNASLKAALRTAIRKFENSAAGANYEEARLTLKKALVAIDKSVTKGILHKNNAARKKSRLDRRFNKMTG
jgi:small subunit ribosomal protein S20